MNRFELSASLIAIEPLKYTPAGLPLIRLQLDHKSELNDAGFMRKLNMHIRATAIGDIAIEIARYKPQAQLHMLGFMAPIKQGSDYLVFHIQELIGTE